MSLRLLLLLFCRCLGGEDAGSAGLLDLLLGRGAEELGLDDHRQLGQMTFAQDFEEAGFADVDDRRFSLNRRSLIFGQEGHQLQNGAKGGRRGCGWGKDKWRSRV